MRSPTLVVSFFLKETTSLKTISDLVKDTFILATAYIFQTTVLYVQYFLVFLSKKIFSGSSDINFASRLISAEAVIDSNAKGTLLLLYSAFPRPDLVLGLDIYKNLYLL
uniref:Uncharacterized protein n=1 Tax=Arundo donax TaxID=35708 RepID=A0A0A9HHS9_ARUDO